MVRILDDGSVKQTGRWRMWYWIPVIAHFSFFTPLLQPGAPMAQAVPDSVPTETPSYTFQLQLPAVYAQHWTYPIEKQLLPSMWGHHWKPMQQLMMERIPGLFAMIRDFNQRTNDPFHQIVSLKRSTTASFIKTSVVVLPVDSMWDTPYTTRESYSFAVASF